MADEKGNTGDCNTGDCNTGDWNTGDWNTGYWNTGDWNTGYRNTGDWNTGYRNTGDRNTGDWNTGYWNTGDCNTGYRNTGDCNTGYRNTGDCNTGYRNTGYRNTGDRNTGDWNTGYWNTGDWNTGYWNTGYFCEAEGPVTFFDLPCSLTRDEAIAAIPYVDLPVGAEWIPLNKMSVEEVAANPNCDHIGGYLKARTMSIQEAMPLVWPTLDIEKRRAFMALPNFDADKFLRLVGVDVRLDTELFPAGAVSVEPCKPKQITLDGVIYNLTPAN